jgi:cell division inhibitor SepF
MSMFDKIGAFFSIRDDEEEYQMDDTSSPRVVPLSTAGRRGANNNQVSVFSPRSYQDVVEIADSLRSRQVVIINLQNADRTLLQRVVDFSSGVAYTIDGRIQKLAESIYLVVPSGVVVNAAGLRDSIMADGTFDFMTNRP